MSEMDPVHAPLAAPTYLTHVTVPVFRRGRAVGVAVMVHMVALALVVLIFNHRFRALPPDEATVSLVVEPSPYVGTGPTVVTPVAKPQTRITHEQAAPQPQRSAATPSNATQTALETTTISASASLPLPAPPAPPAPRPNPVKTVNAAPAPSPHLGNNQPWGYGLVVDTRIVPARPEARINLPPAYPPLALAHGEQGNVLLSIQVAPSGRASAVVIVASSGFLILDNAARDAVLGWRFLPADFHGRAVSSTLLLPIKFEINAPLQR